MKKQIITAIILFSIILLGTASFFGYIYSKTKVWTNLMMPGVSIQGIDVSGKTKEEASKIINEKFGNEIVKKNITITAGVNTYSLLYSKIGAHYNIDEVINEAFSYGKNLGMLKKYQLTKNPKEQTYKLKFVYNPQPVKDLIAGIEKDINKNPVDGSVTLNGGKFIVTPDVKGAKLDISKLETDILKTINGDLKFQNVKLDAPIQVLTAKKSEEKLKEVNTKISSFSTDFSSSSYERSTNIILATKSINGTLLMPGETFSFNGIVGERTPQKGYKQAPVIIGNKVDSGYGGGICQVSTTLYNSVARADILATERTHHTLPSHYIGLGMDATVDYGTLDYKFVNTLDFPIYIEGYTTSNKVIYFNVYSDSSLTKKTYDLVNDVYETIPAQMNYIDDPTLPIGQTVEDQFSSTGYRVRVYKNAYENGKIVEHVLISTDYYLPVTGVTRRGTKQ